MTIIPIIITAGVGLFAVGILMQAYTDGSVVMGIFGLVALLALWVCISIIRK